MKIPENMLEGVEHIWPGIDKKAIKSDCQECSPESSEGCKYAFDLYSFYTEDGKLTNTGPLCLK